ncbi:hypothetical protein LAZ67_12002982 [Cordylochernes scorpioides]|uniref:Uncharacterized protein n=1 Tax=Cordylochernes scorpioides TaxID=51811 RepID=A0ABY6L4L6_9ARAC|nr:hypothetical protein LAZ67_12002982 [Cordylochernes scorpioides]
MDKSKKLRTLLRSSVTKNIKEIETEFDKEYPSRDSILVEFKLLEINERQLRNANSQIRELMLDDEKATIQELEKEQDLVEQYEKNSLRTEKKVNEYLNPKGNDQQGQGDVASIRSSPEKSISCRLPKIALKVYDGTSLEWLGWWSQFEAIHENPSLSEVDKFHYLIQCMKVGTRAERLVKSYPLTEANYPKVIEAIRDRFGDKVILTEVYVRQLLKLVINNVRKKNVSLESLYDQVESHIRSLDSLGVNVLQNSSFLYPLVESSLPEELIRIWQRSAMAGYDRDEKELTHRFLHRTNTVSREIQDPTDREMTSPKDPPASINKQEHLSVPTCGVNAQVYGINNTKGELVKELVSFTLESLTEPGWTLPMKALVVGRMTGLLPTKDLCLAIPPSWKVLPLADLQFEKIGKVDVILGADVYGRLLLPDFRLCNRTHLCAQNTRKMLFYAPSRNKGKSARQEPASTKTSNGWSLNDLLYTGPKLQTDILTILINWRRHKVVMLTNIEKMYRQIMVRPQDAKRQRILWRESPDDRLKPYQLNTVTYVTSPAPFLALQTLLQLARDDERKYPRAAEVIRTDTYVDDILTGAEYSVEALSLQKEFIGFMKGGGFILKKWAANDPSKQLFASYVSGMLDSWREDDRLSVALLNNGCSHNNSLKTSVYGNETLDRSTIQKWVHRLQKGDFDLHDKERPSKPSTVTADQNLALVEPTT